MTTAQWLEVVLSYALQVLLVVAACKGLERWIAKTSDRCTIWSDCFLCILFLCCTAMVLPRLHLIQPWSQLEPRTLLTVTAAQDFVGRLLLAVWCIGMSVTLLRWIVRGQYLRRMLKTCEQMSPEDVQKLFGHTKIGVASSQLPVVLISDAAQGPFCWQLHRATIVLPRFLLEGSRDDLRHVLLHEVEHLTTNHPFQLFWQHLVQVICWFHPAVWNAASRASLLREFTCDEVAAGNGADSAAYLRTLLRIAERCERTKNASTMSFGRTPSEIVLRARRLVDITKNTHRDLTSRTLGRRSAAAVLFAATLLISLIWIPMDPLASSRSMWSPWPRWTTQAAHCFGVSLRDYEHFDRRSQLFEISRQAVNQTPGHQRRDPGDSLGN